MILRKVNLFFLLFFLGCSFSENSFDLILEAQDYVQRIRSQQDKRKVHATLTEKGEEVLKDSPLPLQDSFVQKFQRLESWEQTLLLSSIQRISLMMNADDIDASPVLQLDSNISKN